MCIRDSNFSKKYCNAIQNGFSKDEAMKSAIIKTENIISFSYNPQKKWIEKSDLANQISLQVVNDCGWSFGLIGKEGVDYFKSYFLEKLLEILFWSKLTLGSDISYANPKGGFNR